MGSADLDWLSGYPLSIVLRLTVGYSHAQEPTVRRALTVATTISKIPRCSPWIACLDRKPRDGLVPQSVDAPPACNAEWALIVHCCTSISTRICSARALADFMVI